VSISFKKRIFQIYEAFSAGRIDLLEDVFDENVDFITNAPAEVFPYLGRRVGRAEVIKTLRSVHDEFHSLTFLPIWMITERDTAGVILSVAATQRASRRMVRFFAAHFLRFRADRIIEYRSIMDSLQAVQQVLGHELDLSKDPGSD
jgi:ketosteroid isomerase-like protein